MSYDCLCLNLSTSLVLVLLDIFFGLVLSWSCWLKSWPVSWSWGGDVLALVLRGRCPRLVLGLGGCCLINITVQTSGFIRQCFWWRHWKVHPLPRKHGGRHRNYIYIMSDSSVTWGTTLPTPPLIALQIPVRRLRVTKMCNTEHFKINLQTNLLKLSYKIMQDTTKVNRYNHSSHADQITTRFPRLHLRLA